MESMLVLLLDVPYRSGKLMRFSIREGGLQFGDDGLVGADLYFEGMGNQRRGRADTYSKAGPSSHGYAVNIFLAFTAAKYPQPPL